MRAGAKPDALHDKLAKGVVGADGNAAFQFRDGSSQVVAIKP